jgi:hypothetical protein
MTVVELARLVADCREAQREYFRDRTPNALGRSKKLERDVDEAVRTVLNGHGRQGELFGEKP